MSRKSAFRLLLPILAALAALSAGCMTGRSTSTPRTAVEQALLSQAAEHSISGLNLGTLPGSSYVIKKDFFNAYDAEYLIGTLHRRLLEMGLCAIDDGKTTPDLAIYPVVAHAAIDEISSLIGLPELPVSLPGAGGVTLPETALFKFQSQHARNRMYVIVKDARTNRLVTATEPVSSERFFNRYTLLFLINLRTTDLVAPH